MSSVCPNGHTSSADDYCDVCGSPIAATGSGPAAAPAPPAPEAAPTEHEPEPAGGAETESGPATAGGPAPAVAGGAGEPAGGGSVTCPNCSTENAVGALFCEACGYDFTTGAVPSQPAASATSPSAPSAPPPVAPALETDWVAEAWVDPDWYASQEVEDPCPSPGLPRLIPLRSKSVLLGRVSVSRNTHPEIDLSSDPGVSRRHAQLTTDGTRWFVEDLASSNGTYVGPASGPLPDKAIPVGPKTELSDDDRVYVGAWTRLVIRRVTPEEVEQLAP